MDDTQQDRDAVQPLINQVMAYPLSEATDEMKTVIWKDLPTIENPNGGGSGETKWVVPEAFFNSSRKS